MIDSTTVAIAFGFAAISCAVLIAIGASVCLIHSADEHKENTNGKI